MALTNIVSFKTDIAPLFTAIDIEHMSWFCDLSSYDDVKANAAAIAGRLTGVNGATMPPAHGGGAGPWPAANIALFQAWIDGGCQP